MTLEVVNMTLEFLEQPACRSRVMMLCRLYSRAWSIADISSSFRPSRSQPAEEKRKDKYKYINKQINLRINFIGAV
jgi:hypothetical protein